jgi:hypothetical protein
MIDQPAANDIAPFPPIALGFLEYAHADGLRPWMPDVPTIWRHVARPDRIKVAETASVPRALHPSLR